jgi:hypothetical protein
METKNRKGLKPFIIANPIYDTVFKKLMENRRIAKFFLSTILEQQVEEVSVLPQEFTYQTNMDKPDSGRGKKKEKGTVEYYSIFRLDFMATVRTGDGSLKKILIEVQKSWDVLDVMRFRNYLGEQYTKEDVTDGRKTVLPVTTIYILGTKLSEIECPCVKVGRTYIDMLNRKAIRTKSAFIELLTHDSYVIQAGRITDVRYTTNLNKLLSIFEQNYFIEKNSDVRKEYPYHPDDENMKLITDILYEMGTDPEERKRIETEKEALRILNTVKDPLNRTIEEKDRIIEEKDKSLEEKDKSLEEQAKSLEEKDKENAELKERLAEMECLLRDKQSK